MSELPALDYPLTENEITVRRWKHAGEWFKREIHAISREFNLNGWLMPKQLTGEEVWRIDEINKARLRLEQILESERVMAEAGKIFTLLPKVAQAIGHISKTKKNQQQGFNFRGIDEVLNAIHGPLCEHGVFPTVEVFDIKRDVATTKTGSTMNVVSLLMRVTFYADDGSHVTTTTAGEAMDMADKATNKAMSAAFKYAMFQTFSIPLDEQDADEVTPEPAQRKHETPAKTAEEVFQEALAGYAAAKYPTDLTVCDEQVMRHKSVLSPEQITELRAAATFARGRIMPPKEGT